MENSGSAGVSPAHHAGPVPSGPAPHRLAQPPMRAGRPRSQEASRFAWLDALRGWAIVGVILVHAESAVPGLDGAWKTIADAGQYGVQLFFVVSALTIFLTYGRQLDESPDRMSAALAWLARRAFRIGPLYYFGIVVYCLMFSGMRAMGSAAPPFTLSDLLANLLFLHEWIPSAQNAVVPGGWSIGVEMFFYLTVPLIAAAVRSARAAAAFLLAAMILGDLAGWVLAPLVDGSSRVLNDSYLYFWFPSQLPVFLAGLLLFLGAGQWLWREAKPSLGRDMAASLGFLAAAAAGIGLGTGGDLDHVLAAALMGIAFCCLAVAAKGGPGRLLATPLLVRLGRVSYSLYMNHFIFVHLARLIVRKWTVLAELPPWLLLILTFAATVAASWAMSEITFRAIELPGMALGKRISRRLARRSGQPAAAPARTGS